MSKWMSLLFFLSYFRKKIKFATYLLNRRCLTVKKKEYKFYKNKRTRFHPSIEVDSNEKTWKNLEVTSSPASNGRYIELKNNPSGSEKKAFVRKYLRNDSIKTRGQLLKKYHLSEEDLIEIEKFLLKNKKS